MGFLDWASSQVYIKRHIAQIRREHDAWAREAAKNLPATWWTALPVHAPDSNSCVEVPIHDEYVFTEKSRAFPGQLYTVHGTHSWTIWYQFGPLTKTRQMTHASWEASRLGHHAAEMARAQQAVSDAAVAELRRRYPYSAKALANA